ncbi:MAG: DUF4114 domain-containing protein [Rivularia sp. (in: cyanobacteria)]
MAANNNEFDNNNSLPQSPTNNLDVSAATYLGGADDDFTNAVDISVDGNFVIVGGSLKNTNFGGAEFEVLGGGDGSIVRYDSQTNEVVATTRLPGKVLDLEVSKNGDIAVAYEGGIAVLNADATEVKWDKSLSNASRIAISDSGTVGVIEDIDNASDKAYLFDSEGKEKQQWDTGSSGRHFYDIAVTDQNKGMVIATGYEQKADLLQVAFTEALSYGGEDRWKNYDFNAGEIQGEGLTADTRGTHVSIGRDGQLYAAYKVNGGTGSSIFYRDPNDLTEKVTDDRKIETDDYNRPTDISGGKITWYGRYNLETGDLIKGQTLLARQSNDGKSVTVSSITATEDGTVILGGDAAFKIANRDDQTIEGQPVSEYTKNDGYDGFDAYLAVISPDLKQRISWTPIPDSDGAVAAYRDGKTAVVTTTNFKKNQITHNAIQDSAGGNKDGYLLVIGGNDVPPTEIETPQDEIPTEEETPVNIGGDEIPTEEETPVNTGGDDDSLQDNPLPIIEPETDNSDSILPGLIDLRNIDLDGDNQLDENVTVEFLDIQSDADYNNSVGYYTIANMNGAVEDITGELINPGEEGYAAAALNQRVENLELTRNTGNLESALDGGALLLPFLIANGTVEEWMEENSDNQGENVPTAYFSFASANPDGKEHIRQVGDELQFEDLFGGGDNDFNDFVTTIDMQNAV